MQKFREIYLNFRQNDGMRKEKYYNKDTYIRKVGLSGLFFVYILKYGKAIPGELSRYIESGDKLYDLVEQEMV